VLKMNFFSEKAEGGKKRREKEEDEDDEDKEERDEDEVEVAVKWMGSLFTIFVAVTMILFVVFSGLYLHYVFNNPTVVFKTVPISKFEVQFLDEPNIDISVLYGYNGPCTVNSTFSDFEVSLDQEPIEFTLTKTENYCEVKLSTSEPTPAGTMISLALRDEIFLPIPPYVQAIGYSLQANYHGVEEEWRSVPTPGKDLKDDDGSSFCGGLILPSSSFLLRGNSLVQIAMNYRPVFSCDRLDQGPSSRDFWNPANILKQEKIGCENTRASTKLFSVGLVTKGQTPDTDYWAISADNLSPSNFSITLQFKSGLLAANVYVLTSTSYGEVITATVIAVISTSSPISSLGR